MEAYLEAIDIGV
jgi:hypothetical protein